MSDSSTRPLRILAVVSLPWDPRLGAARVMTDLVAEWEQAGHHVEKYCLTDAYPTPTSSQRLSALRFANFPARAAAYLRQNAGRFDVVDALIGTCPFSRDSLGFRGLLVGRSVGLHRLYHRFEKLSRRRWPDKKPGGLLSSLYYGMLMRRLRRNAEKAIHTCDLLNLPNESELRELHETSAPEKAAIVQPYGLRDAHRAALENAALPAEERLRNRKIVFLGAWSLRKGAGDWAEIIRRIWEEMPEARFKFLGTMTPADAILAQLGLPAAPQIECIPEFEPADLPALLRGATVALFPSYVEGFGIAVLEQLAAGLPTVAYDVPGPREILEAQRERLLSPVGEPGALAERALRVLRMDAAAYAAFSTECMALSARYRCADIAAETARRYAATIERIERSVVFTEPFALASPGGGPRILRSLLQDAPLRVVSICTASAAPARPYRDERHVPIRPDFGRVERTRLTRFIHPLTPIFSGRFRRRLKEQVTIANACALHAIAHGGLDFHDTFLLAKEMRLPFFLQVHDDVVYTGSGRVPAAKLEQALAEAWQGAAARFVISRELGLEYQRRYGDQEVLVITDGLDEVAPAARPRTGQLRIYFMGLFHLGYEENLQAFIQALELLRPQFPEKGDCSITLRCDYLRPALQRQSSFVRVLPFGSEADVQADLAEADALYLPLHFSKADEAFGAYSLSTKMVTYLGSGLPIVYHGPAGTAAEKMLRENGAAAFAASLDPAEIAATLRRLLQRENVAGITENALRLARRNFLRADQHQRFWNTITEALTSEQEDNE